MKGIKDTRLKNLIRITVPFIIVPALIALGIVVFDDKKYTWISLAVAISSILVFQAGFEKKTIGSRRLVIISVMTALSVVGRLVFSAVPGFRPITALVVITAIYLGGESGFMVGCMSALVSNFFFGQGPWTPFQMFIWGMIGLLAGLLAKPLKKSRVLLSLYGVFAGVAYSFFMDIWTVLSYADTISWQLYVAALGAAVPYTVMYAVSNVIFLLLLGKPFGEKLERIKVKYGV